MSDESSHLEETGNNPLSDQHHRERGQQQTGELRQNLLSCLTYHRWKKLVASSAAAVTATHTNSAANVIQKP